MSQPDILPLDADSYPYGERHFTRRLLRYWEEKRGIRALPEENDIDPDELGEDWGSCFLLQSRDMANIVDYNFTYLGPKIMQAYRDRALDEHNEFIVGPNARNLSRHFQKVLTSCAPVLDEAELSTLQGLHIAYRQIMLPCGNDDGVTAVFGGMHYKVLDWKK